MKGRRRKRCSPKWKRRARTTSTGGRAASASTFTTPATTCWTSPRKRTSASSPRTRWARRPFPAFEKFEDEVVDWTLDLLHAPPGATGVMTSGGTESLFLALATARDWARVEKPAIVAARDRHPVERASGVRQGRALPWARRSARTAARRLSRRRRRDGGSGHARHDPRRRLRARASARRDRPDHATSSRLAQAARPVVPRRCLRRRLHRTVRQARGLPGLGLRFRDRRRRLDLGRSAQVRVHGERRVAVAARQRSQCGATWCSTSTTGRAGTTARRRFVARVRAARSLRRGRSCATSASTATRASRERRWKAAIA